MAEPTAAQGGRVRGRRPPAVAGGVAVAAAVRPQRGRGPAGGAAAATVPAGGGARARHGGTPASAKAAPKGRQEGAPAVGGAVGVVCLGRVRDQPDGRAGRPGGGAGAGAVPPAGGVLSQLCKGHGRVAVWRSDKPDRVSCAVCGKLLAVVVRRRAPPVWAGARARRSLYRAARGVRRQALRLSGAPAEVTALAAVPAESTARLGRRCRVDKRRRQPALFETARRLPAGVPGQQAAAEANGRREHKETGTGAC